MSAERAPDLGAGPGLTGVRVADDVAVDPLLSRAVADLSALTFRLGTASHRADAAEAKADLTPEDEADELRRRLDDERAEHERRLEVELDQARAEAADLVAMARAGAGEVLRAASLGLEDVVAAVGGGATSSPLEVPVASPVVVVAPRAGSAVVVDAPSSAVEAPLSLDRPDLAPEPSLRERLKGRGALLLVEVAVLLVVVLFVWVR